MIKAWAVSVAVALLSLSFIPAQTGLDLKQLFDRTEEMIPMRDGSSPPTINGPRRITIRTICIRWIGSCSRKFRSKVQGRNTVLTLDFGPRTSPP